MNRRLVHGRVFGVMSQLAAIGLLLTSAWLIVRAAEHPPVLYLMVAIVAVRFFGLARAALRYVERLLTHDAAFAMVTDARVEVYRELDRAAPVGMSGSRRGDLVSRVVSDVDALLDRVLRLRSPWIVALGSTAAVVTLVALIDVRSASVVGVSTTLVMIVLRHGPRSPGDAEGRGELSAEVSHVVLASSDLLAYGAGDRVLASVHRSVGRLAASQRRGAWVSGLGSSVVLASTGVSIAVLAAMSNGLDPVLVGVVLLAPLALAEPLEALADAERLRPGIQEAEERLTELALVPDPVLDPPEPLALPATSHLRVEGLAVGWDSTVASDISFELAEGEALALTGPSGSGKSTLALTLARLIEPRSGRVLLGGSDLRSLAATDVRTRIGYLGQDEIVFDTTIRENLRIADPHANDEAMQEALAQAGLSDFVTGLPRGLDTPVGEHGNRLSGGERQRLCLTRLLLGDHQVLVVDEPTEHLDEEAGDSLIRDLLALCPERSILVVTHSRRVVDTVGRAVSLGERMPVRA